jgi:outer membrane immunogenic protein
MLLTRTEKTRPMPRYLDGVDSMVGLRSVLLGGVAAVAFSGAAFAADVPARGPVYAKAPPAGFSWQGQYIGIHGGYAWANNEVNIAGVVGEINPSGGVFGLQIGYNHHLSRHWVVGYEVDVSFADLNETALVGGVITPFEINVFGTARARLGYATGPWLFYATAGMAWANTDLRGVAGVASFERPHVGYAIGAGIEYALSQNWSAKIEYLYADLGETNSVINAAPINTDLTLSVVRLGLNYRFANWGPVPAQAQFTKAPVQVAGWTGPYVGIHGGYGWGSFDTLAGAVAQSQEPKGGFGGIQSGYNWQLSRNWVIGVESDSSWGSISQNAGGISVDIDAMGTVRARLGYAMNNLLFYGTGGLAWAHADSATFVAVRDQFYLGWTAGVGVEYAFNQRWSLKAEYLYADYGTINDFNGAAVNASLDVSTVKIGLNYRASLFSLLTNR